MDIFNPIDVLVIFGIAFMVVFGLYLLVRCCCGCHYREVQLLPTRQDTINEIYSDNDMPPSYNDLNNKN